MKYTNVSTDVGTVHPAYVYRQGTRLGAAANNNNLYRILLEPPLVHLFPECGDRLHATVGCWWNEDIQYIVVRGG